jgi:hypothetical protein
MARPRKLIDQELVKRLATIGCTDDEIAFVLEIGEATVKRRCRAALNAGRACLRMRLRRKQLQAAWKGSVPMLIWLGKQYLGQTDRQEIRQSERLEVVEEVVFPKDGDGVE